jgi:hypothetical protein
MLIKRKPGHVLLQTNSVVVHYYTTKDCYICNNCEDILQPDTAERAFLFDKCHANLERSAQDSTINNYGYKSIELCKNNEMYIVNGRAGNDKKHR